MIGEVRAFVIRRAENGEEQAFIRVTREANGCGVWYQERSQDPRLLAWHVFSPRFNTEGVVTAAVLHGRRVANDAVIHGEYFAEALQFEQVPA